MTHSMEQILSFVAVGISVMSAVIAVINHTEVRSRCCRYTAVVSLDIDRTNLLCEDPAV